MALNHLAKGSNPFPLTKQAQIVDEEPVKYMGSYKDPEKRRAYLREYNRKRAKEQKKRYEKTREAEFDKYPYRIVSNTWRSLVQPMSQYDLLEIDSPLVNDLWRGKTIFVDYTIPHGAYNSHPFRTLYSYFSIRGYRLRVHVVDLVDKEEYRKLLMWTEPIKPMKWVPKKEEESAA